MPTKAEGRTIDERQLELRLLRIEEGLTVLFNAVQVRPTAAIGPVPAEAEEGAPGT